MQVKIFCFGKKYLFTSFIEIISFIRPMKDSMGNTESSASVNRDEIGEQIFEIVGKMYPDSAAEITGMILETDDDDLKTLIDGDHHELYKRIRKAANVIKQTKEDQHKLKDSTVPQIDHHFKDIINNLVKLFQRKYNESEALLISNALINVSEAHRNKLLANEKLLNAFAQEVLKKHEKDTICDKELPESCVEEPKEISNSEIDPCSDLSEEELGQLAGDKLFERLQSIHPGCASVLCGIMITIPFDILAQILDNDDWLFKYLGETVQALQRSGGLQLQTISEMKEEVGELLYKRLPPIYPDESEETLYQVTGMLLDIDLFETYSLLRDDVLLKSRAELAFDALESNIPSGS